MNIPSLLHQRELALLSIIAYLNNTTSSAVSPASVVTKCKSRLSGSNVSRFTGVSAIIWIICKMALEVSSSVVVCRWPQLKPNFGSSGEQWPSSGALESWLLSPLQWGFWQSEDIFFVLFCFFCSEKIFTKLHTCWWQITSRPAPVVLPLLQVSAPHCASPNLLSSRHNDDPFGQTVQFWSYYSKSCPLHSFAKCSLTILFFGNWSLLVF